MPYKTDIPEHIKKWVVREKEAGKSNREVSRIISVVYPISFNSVSRVYNRWRQEKTVKRRKRKGGRPKKMTVRQERK